MASVRISGNWRNPNRQEWGGAFPLDDQGHFERKLDFPEKVYQTIEEAIQAGHKEGRVVLEGGTQVNWLVD